MHWEPLDSPFAQAKKAVYKRLVKVRAAFILLFASWFMKPNHFQAGVDSIYKDLGWGLPLIPANTYAGGCLAISAPLIERLSSASGPGIGHVIPHFSTFLSTCYFLLASILVAGGIYLGASASFGFHCLMCGFGRILGMREAPPPYEFFLVRTAGVAMWFSIGICLMAVPVLAQRPDLIGHLAAGFLAVPLLWTVLFGAAGVSWLYGGNRAFVHLNDMYESDRFVRLVSRTQWTLAVLTLAGITLLPNLMLSRPTLFRH